MNELKELTDRLLADDLDALDEPVERVDLDEYVECDTCGDLLRRSNAYGLDDEYTSCIYCLENEADASESE